MYAKQTLIFTHKHNNSAVIIYNKILQTTKIDWTWVDKQTIDKMIKIIWILHCVDRVNLVENKSENIEDKIKDNYKRLGVETSHRVKKT